MIINIDIDNTVNDFLEQFIFQFNAVTGRNITNDDITSYWLSECTGVPYDTLSTLFFKNNQFYAAFSPLPYSQDAVKALMDAGHTVRFVTAINYEVITSRLDFVRRFFPFMDIQKQLIVTEHKEFIYADIVVDDSVDNLKNVNGDCKFILFKQPWNIDWQSKYPSFDRWEDILQYIMLQTK